MYLVFMKFGTKLKKNIAMDWELKQFLNLKFEWFSYANSKYRTKAPMGVQVITV